MTERQIKIESAVTSLDEVLVDLTRRSESFFESEELLGPLISHRITLRRGWVENQPVLRRHDTRTILLELRAVSAGYEATTLEAVYLQTQFPLIEEDQIDSLRMGLWHGMTLDQRWHPQDYWCSTLVSTLWTGLANPRALSTEVLDGPHMLEELPEGLAQFAVGVAQDVHS